MDLAYIEYGIQPCKIGCNEDIIYHFLQLSDGFHLFYPVNVPLKDNGSIDIDYQQEIYPADKLPWKSTIHVCHLDAEDYNEINAGIAADELETISEGVGSYPTPNELIEHMHTILKTEELDQIEKDMQQQMLTYFGLFKSTLNLHPALWLHAGPDHPPPGSEYEHLDWQTLPIMALIELYIIERKWLDALQLWKLQDLVFDRINEVNNYHISDKNKERWKDVQFLIMKKLSGYEIHQNYPESKQNENQITIENKIEEVLFRLRNYIRKQIPDWRTKHYEKFEKAENTRKHTMKNNPIFKEKKDELDWLEFGDLLFISNIYSQYEPLHTRINSIKQYRNSGDGAHPYEINKKNPAVENFYFYLCDECLKDFDKLENQ